MDPTIIVYAIRALLRLGREGRAAYDQFQRDNGILFPGGLKAEWETDDVIAATFFPAHQNLITGDGPYARFWDRTRPAAAPGAREALYAGALQILAEEQAATTHRPRERAIEIGGVLLVQQWAEGKGPVGPVSRMVVTLADVALEFVGANPSVIGVGGNGEKLIGAIAANLAELIPDDGEEFGERSALAERFAGIFLRAGLQALNDHTQTVIRQEHLQTLVRNVLPPLVAALPKGLPEQARWRDVADALLGPAANAAVATIAANPTGFLGRGVESSRVLGALTQAVLQEAARTGVRGLLTEAGFSSMYTAVVSVAAERPELFLGRAGAPPEQLARELFAAAATTLRSNPPPFDSDLGAELAAAGLDVVRQHGAALLLGDGAWKDLFAALLGQLATGLRPALANDGDVVPGRAFTRQQVLELGRVFLRQVALTPALIAPGSRELQDVVGAVAGAMAADRHLLLAPDDWLQVAAVAARAAAANPGRLFRLDAALGGVPAAALISDLVAVAAAELAAADRPRAGVLFGATLRTAITLLLERAAGTVAAAVARRQELAELAAAISAAIQANSQRYGAREWLALYEGLITPVLHGKAVPKLTAARIGALLSGGPV